MDLYQQYIHKSRYARYIPELKRREHWDETVERFVSFVASKISNNVLTTEVRNNIKNAIVDMKVMPSMRAMMTAGLALDRDNTAGYNCSYLPIDDAKAFDEAMVILMNGTGVGFSVERQYVNKLPEIPEEIYDTDTTITVRDSKEGWGKALRMLIALLYSGELPKWDLSKLRPAGTVLKTFGGRSSGPAPLDELFRFVVNVFKGAKGRKLTSIECHDIMCKIGEVVVVGGVRRSAMISLSNLSDDRMRNAKSGAWWEQNVQRALSNNSAVYTEKPDVHQFMQEWLSLYESKSGERGIFSREASKNVCKKNGRRDPDHDFGTNPSLRAGTKIWTSNGIVPIETLEGKNFKVKNLRGEVVDATCWLSGNDKPLLKVSLSGGHSYYATKEHKWPVYRNGKLIKVTTPELKNGDYLPIIKSDSISDSENGSYEDGFVIGWNLGDGWQTKNTNNGDLQIGFIVSDEDKQYGIDQKIQKYLMNECDYNGSILNKNEINVNNQKLRNIFDKFGVMNKKDGLPKSVWSDVSDQFIAGLIDGLFSSDGHLEPNSQRIVLTSSNVKLIEDVSELLGFYGIKSNINTSVKDGYVGGNGVYYDKQVIRYDLKINQWSSIEHFRKLFKLSHERKQNILESYTTKNPLLDDKIRVDGVFDDGVVEDCWDIKVFDDTHCFQLSHCITGNCSEIILRPYQFCVSPNTPLITKENGIRPISSFVDRQVSIWNGEEWTPVTVRKTGSNQKLMRVYLNDGSYLDCTPDHRWSVKDRFSEEWKEVKTKDLMNVSKYSLHVEPCNTIAPVGGVNVDSAYTMGFAVGDGCVYKNQTLIDLHGSKDWMCPVEGIRHKKQLNQTGTSEYIRCNATEFAKPDLILSLKENGDAWTELLGSWNKESVMSFVAGLADADGSETGTGGIRIYINSYDKGRALQLLLAKFGVRCSINLHQKEGTPTNLCVRKRDSWYVQITNCADIPCHRLDVSEGHEPKFKGKYQNIVRVEELEGLHDTYCFNEPKRHKGMFGNVLTYQCNLTEVIARADDTEKDLIEKVKLAAILGTIQSTFTNFPYLRKIWKKNTEEERLLGVSITGIYDCPLLNDYKDPSLPGRLEMLRQVAVDTNKEFAEMLGIPQSASVTCVKPSGCFVPETQIKTTEGIKSLQEIFEMNDINLDEKSDDYREWYDIKVPLRVYDENNDEQNITKLFVNGVEKTIKFTMDDGSIIECTENHKFKLKDGTWKMAKDLSEDDDILTF